ncbi:MAG: FKBP-type peptidyl-prolyl cis-trans isomerase [Candidatus Krumholzibacteria bacterium]|nr:FKBP-type peptidyl-prolyl cis-trans isomerase [Candidatus Krumholzibacteria bacterium]
MRHLRNLAPALVGLLLLPACGGSSGDHEEPLTVLEPGLQTVSYAIGMDLAQQIGGMPGADNQALLLSGLKDRLADKAKLTDEIARDVMQSHHRGVDTPDFASKDFATEDDQRSYALGVAAAGFVKQQFPELDARALAQGMRDKLQGSATLVAADQIPTIVGDYQREQYEKRSATNQAAGQVFLAENAQRDGVQVTESGLQYEILTAGDGPLPKATDTVEVHYLGTLLDGTKFDSSYDRGSPASFALNRVIAGWTEGVQLMPVGSKYKFYVPSNLAYGENGAGPLIGPHATLVFEIELLGILE